MLSTKGEGGMLRLLHSSDVHVDNGYVPPAWAGDPLGGLRRVLRGARAEAADAVLLAGDTFEHNRLADHVVAAAAELIAESGVPVVVLPGNHDPAMPGSVFHRFDLPANFHVLGVNRPETLVLPELDLEMRGRAHRDYLDMYPLPDPAPRTARHLVIIAHGHHVPRIGAERWQPSWLFTDDALPALGADYIALGHWNRHVAVGPAGVLAVYSGSPDHEGTANLVELGGGARMRRVALE